MLLKWLVVLLCLCFLPAGSFGEESCGFFEYEKLPDGGIAITRFMDEESRFLEIPPSLDGLPVLRIGEYAFAYSGLERVIIPEGVTEIGACAFNACSELNEISLPNSLRRLEADAFLCCTALEEITFPKELEFIGDEAFYNCQNLKKADVPFGTQFGARVFEACYLLNHE